MESTDSSTNSQQPNLPPGFRFHPTDEELVVHYLKKKAASLPLPAAVIAEVDIYKFDPWELPAKASFGEQEWYFFTPRDRKYPNGARPNRAATSGYWKATGTDKPVLSAGGSQKVGVKKALVFYGGKPPRGIKTNWIMHEYRLAHNKPSNKPPGWDLGNKKNSLRLDDSVLCRIYKKNNTHRSSMDHDKDDSMDDLIGGIPPSINVGQMNARFQPLKMSSIYNNNALHENDHQNLYDGVNSAISSQLVTPSNSKAAELPMVPTMATNSNSKRTLSSHFWNEDELVAGISSAKKLSLDTGDGSVVRTEENGSSIAPFLNQFPQTPSLHQQPMMGPLPPYQISGVNWYA